MLPRVAVIGCGVVSVVHFEAIAAIEACELVGVADVDPAAAEAAGQRYGVPAFLDLESLIAEVEPDVVHVCTPHDAHVPVSLAALQAGIAVLQEKPIGRTVAEAARLIDVAEQGRTKIGICFQNRYNATSQAMRSILDRGELGSVIGASAVLMWNRPQAYYTARPWRGRLASSGGGVLINQAIHTLDLLLWLLGDPVTVTGRTGRRLLNGVEIEDTADLVLHHASGARSVVFATITNTVDAPVSLEITTEQATLSLRGDLTVRYVDGREEVIRERVAASSGRAYWGVSHEVLIRDFYARLDDPEPFWISPREATRSLAVIEQVYAQSSLR